ncbi:MAG: transglutaminase-like domain-containing protein [Candidatus Thermoplasmatota archaeon]|nr:transglutaminase-like domain-containing protein [Candidatus Thermoplasmatota archaeon]
MARCPYCVSLNPVGASVCNSCGRFILGARGMASRVGPQSTGGPVAYSARRGPAPGRSSHRGKKRRDRKKKKNIRTLALVLVIAFLFLFTPAQDRLEKQLGKWMDQLMEEMAGYREYPVSVSYTVERHVILNNVDNRDVWFEYRLPIPKDRTERGIWDVGFEMQSGADFSAYNVQKVHSMSVSTSSPSSSTVSIPLDGTIRNSDDSIDLDGMTEIFWPQTGDDGYRCRVGKCAMWMGDIAPLASVTLVVSYEVTANSFDWWDDSGLTSNIARSTSGFSIDDSNSGTFDDISERSGYLATMHSQVGSHKKWYDRDSGAGTNWAINGENSVIDALAREIRGSLSASEQDNVHAFTRAAFTHVYNEIVYAQGMPGNARSGPQCIADGRGDCDEQSNAWMSLLRVYEISAWYEFGPMSDAEFETWEPHAWANVLLPMDGGWCNEKGVEIESCYVEASVDVVNNKWLLHTPTSFTQWVEEPSSLGEGAYKFYRPLLSNGPPGMWTEMWSTVGDVEMTGGTYEISAWVE